MEDRSLSYNFWTWTTQLSPQFSFASFVSIVSEKKILNKPNLHKWHISDKRRISYKNKIDMLNFSFLHTCTLNLSLFWLKIKQKWSRKKDTVFNNGSHLEWRASLLDIIFNGVHHNQGDNRCQVMAKAPLVFVQVS